MTQRDLFDSLPSHQDDPESSKKAARKALPRANTHARFILDVLRWTPDMTATQICKAFDGTARFAIEHHERLYQVRRRLSDLKRMGLVEQSGQGSETTWRAKVGEPDGN